MANQRHVLFLVSFYPTEQRPHHGIFFRDHAQAIAQFDKVTVGVIRTPSWKESGRIRSKVQIYRQERVHTMELDQPVPTHRLPSWQKLAQKRALKKIAKHITPPDLIIAQTSLPPGEWAIEMASRYQDGYKPIAVIEHFSFLESMFAHQAQAVKQVYSRVKAIGCVSQYMEEKIEGFLQKQKLSKPVVTIGNVLGQDFEQQGYVPPPDQTPFKWLFIGPDDKEKKGVDILAKAFTQMPDNHWTLTVVGEGSYDELRRLLPEEKVTILSPRPRKQIISLMQSHHALVSSSRVETFGMAIIEMLSCGRPVVVTSCGGPQEYMKSAFGKMVEPAKPEALAHGMISLMRSYKNYHSKSIRDSIINQFGSKAFYDRFNHLFSEANN